MKSFNNRHYDIDILLPTPQKQKIMVGGFIRRTIGKGYRNTGPDALPIRTFRVRHGNGYYGTKLGEVIQDQYDYFIPSSINNPEGQASRDKFAAAVLLWHLLTDEQKKFYDDEIYRLQLHMSGYNLYIRRYMKDEI